MKNTILLSLPLILIGCATPLDTVKFKQDIGVQDIDGKEIISRCAYIPFKYERQVQQPYRQCAYIQNESGFHLYETNKATRSYQKAYDIPYRGIGCVIHYVNGPSKGVIAFLTDTYMFQVSLLDLTRDIANQDARNQALTGLRSHGVKIYEHGSEVANPLFVYSFTLNNICKNADDSKPKRP